MRLILIHGIALLLLHMAIDVIYYAKAHAQSATVKSTITAQVIAPAQTVVVDYESGQVCDFYGDNCYQLQDVGQFDDVECREIENGRFYCEVKND